MKYTIAILLVIPTLIICQNNEGPETSDTDDSDIIEDTILQQLLNETAEVKDTAEVKADTEEVTTTELIDKYYDVNDTTTEIVTETVANVYRNDSDSDTDKEETIVVHAEEVTSTESVKDTATNVYRNESKCDIDKEEMETTPHPTTAAADDEEAEDSIDQDKDDETIGQRSPKTEQSDQEAPDQRPANNKPRATPVISRSSTLKSWLEDTWLRPPAGVLVPIRPMALNRALAVWKDLIKEGLNVTDIVIVGYDSNGVNWRSRHNLQPYTGGKERDVPEALSKLLLKYQGVRSDSSVDGTMRALATAAKLVPYDSALFVITDKGAGDPQRLPLALRALVEKRLKVYTIWTDPNHPSVESEAALTELRNISKHTEGDVLPYSMKIVDMEQSNMASDMDIQPWEPMEANPGRRGRVYSNYEFERFDSLLVRRGGGEAISLGLPVESGVKALKILIEGAVDHAVLYPPNEGPQIDLYNDSSISAFSPGSRIERMSPREVFLIFPGAPPDVDTLAVIPAATSSTPHTEMQTAMAGVWHLSVRCDTCDYRLCVSARSDIHLDVQVKDLLRIRVNGPVASVRESSLVDEFETELDKLSFSFQPIAGEDQDIRKDLVTELVADVVLPAYKGSKVYVKIVGRDIKGEPFVRLSGPLPATESRQSRSTSIVFPENLEDLELIEEENLNFNSRLRVNDSNVLPNGRNSNQVVNQLGLVLTSVQIGLSTRLYGAPGDTLQLHFEVSNYRDQSVRFNFGAEGELRFLVSLSPTSQVIPSGQTVNVIVTLRIRNAAQPGARDLITFTAYGVDQVSISTYVYVINPGTTTPDVWAPEMTHNFQGSCTGRLGDNCAQHTWSATVIARDALGGLLRLTSSPIGLIYDSNYISGTREQVQATYRATCCTPRVVVTGVDSYGNVNSYVIDISNYLTEAAIAAIVLAVVLGILLILIVIYLIYFCVKRRKESRELPYTTSSRNIS